MLCYWSEKLKKRRFQILETPEFYSREIMRRLGISFRIKMKQTVNIGGIAEFAVIEIQTVLDSIDLDGKIFTFRHVIDNGADFCEIYGHWHYFHDPCFEASSECYDF